MHGNRRDFLIASALVASGRRLAATEPAIRFPAAPRERLAIASYSLRAVLDSPRNRTRPNPSKSGAATLIDLKDFPAFAIKRFQVRNIEVLGQHLGSTEPAYLDEFRAAVKSAGCQLVNIPTSVGASLYDPDAARRETAAANAKKWIDVAVALECPSVRIHIQGVKDTAPDAGRVVASLGPVVQYGSAKGVVVNLENDDLTTEDAFFLVKVIDQVNSPWLRALPDFCNSMMGGNEQFNYDAVTAMFRRAYNIAHLKDSEVDRGKVFRVSLERTFGIAKAAGYKGYFSVEFEGEGDPILGTEKLVEESLKYL
jgi:sugar phosphate isomerase/epimerase